MAGTEYRSSPTFALLPFGRKTATREKYKILGFLGQVLTNVHRCYTMLTSRPLSCGQTREELALLPTLVPIGGTSTFVTRPVDAPSSKIDDWAATVLPLLTRAKADEYLNGIRAGERELLAAIGDLDNLELKLRALFGPAPSHTRRPNPKRTTVQAGRYRLVQDHGTAAGRHGRDEEDWRRVDASEHWNGVAHYRNNRRQRQHLRHQLVTSTDGIDYPGCSTEPFDAFGQQ